jgi:hypothetical protein
VITVVTNNGVDLLVPTKFVGGLIINKLRNNFDMMSLWQSDSLGVITVILWKLISTKLFQVKFQKRKREQPGTFTHPDGPAAAASAMVNHLEQVYNGEFLNGTDNTLDFSSSDSLPHTDSILYLVLILILCSLLLIY